MPEVIMRHLRGSFRKTFPVRATEWWLTAMMLHWSYVLNTEEELFERSHSFDFLHTIGAQHMWGQLLFWVAVLRLVALIINGLWHRTPHVRAVSAFVSSGFWFLIAMSFIMADHPSTGIAVYPWLFVAEAVNVFRAAKDAGISDTLFEKSYKHGTASR